MIGSVQLQGRIGGDAMLPGIVDFRIQILLHGGFVKNVTAEDFRNMDDVGHGKSTLSETVIWETGRKPQSNPIIPYYFILGTDSLQAVKVNK